MERDKPKSFIIKTNKTESKDTPIQTYNKKQPLLVKKGKDGLRFDNNSQAIIQNKSEINKNQMTGLPMHDHFTKEHKTRDNDSMQRMLDDQTQNNKNEKISEDDMKLLKTVNLDYLEAEVARLEDDWNKANQKVRDISIAIYNNKEILRQKEKADTGMDKE